MPEEVEAHALVINGVVHSVHLNDKLQMPVTLLSTDDIEVWRVKIIFVRKGA